LNAQWLNYPTPGIPRLPDGKPDLSAPAAKTADGKLDLSGIWGRGGFPKMADAPLQPAARALVEHRDVSDNKGSPLTTCLPTFFIHIAPFTLYKIVQTPGLVVMVSDGTLAPSLPRQIFTDGRPLPKDPTPSWMGYSVGHWEGNAFIVETMGFNNRGWLPGGIPMTETTRVTERFERVDFGHMKLQITMDDPQTFTKPWTFNLTPQLQPDTELLEFVCENNDVILSHMIDAKER
jgi:hypothetical protein